MDVQKKLDEIVEVVNAARSMPMSASCVINRADLLAMLEEVREALPGSLAQAQELIGERERMVGEARAEAERIIRGAHDERGSLVADTAVARQSQGEADRILNEARREAAEVKADADDYVDSKLANFEVVLTKTLGSVGRGREKLLGTSDGLDAQGYEDPDYAEAPERSGDPETLRRRADEYVDVKLGAFEAVLAKTLDAVGRGRDKLHGRVATDDLAALGEDGGERQYSSDSDYLADLAATRDASPDAATRGDNPAGGTGGRGTSDGTFGGGASDGTFGGGTSGGLVLPPLPEPAVAALPEQTPHAPRAAALRRAARRVRVRRADRCVRLPAADRPLRRARRPLRLSAAAGPVRGAERLRLPRPAAGLRAAARPDVAAAAGAAGAPGRWRARRDELLRHHDDQRGAAAGVRTGALRRSAGPGRGRIGPIAHSPVPWGFGLSLPSRVPARLVCAALVRTARVYADRAPACRRGRPPTQISGPETQEQL
ncbi:H+-ATPase subunit H [Streptomyces sp. SolWspMP-sol7th]|nr:H+-ATPase subunit H [Streptomyces sp. SolWspMP-sol7th]